MEKRINRRVEEYFASFKEDVKNKMHEINDCTSMPLSSSNPLLQLFQYINDYDRLVITKQDLQKKPQPSPSFHTTTRCCALRANGTQCTRRRHPLESLFCGTHHKSNPHGCVTASTTLLASKTNPQPEDMQASSTTSSSPPSPLPPKKITKKTSPFSSSGLSASSSAATHDLAGPPSSPPTLCSEMISITVWGQEIHGIYYFVDSKNNVYDTSDILNNIPNPRVIATCVVNKDTGVYTIPDFGI